MVFFSCRVFPLSSYLGLDSWHRVTEQDRCAKACTLHSVWDTEESAVASELPPPARLA